MDSTLMVRVVVALCLLLLAGYFIGSAVNRRLRRKLALWIKPAVDDLGGQVSVRWLGTSALQVEVCNLPPPGEALGIFLSMQPREMPLFWLFNHLRGRRDRLILRTNLSPPPRAALDLWRRDSGETYRKAGKAEPQQEAGEEWQRGQFVVSLPPGTPREAAEAAARLVEAEPARWEWLSVRPSSPHLSALVTLFSPPSGRAESIFSLLDQVSQICAGSGTPRKTARPETHPEP